MEQFLGFNKFQDSAAISDDEAQDAVNCFFHNRTMGLLGPRKGRSWVSSSVLSDTVVGVAKLELPSGDRDLIAVNSGHQLDVASIPQEVTTYITGNTASGKSLTVSTLDLDHPDTSASLLTTFADSSEFDPDESLFVSWGFGLDMTGDTSWTSGPKLRIEFGINENGTASYLWTYDITTEFSGAWSIDGAVKAAYHNATDTIIGGAFRISWPDGSWPTGAVAGHKVSLSSLLVG